MNAKLRRATKISVLAFTLIVLSTIVTVTSVMGAVDMNRPKTVQPGYADAFVYTVDNFKNQRFTIFIELDVTVPEGFVLYAFCVPRNQWERIRDNSTLHIDDIPAANFLFNGSVEKTDGGSILEPVPDSLEYEVIIPSLDPWTFVFLNLNGADLLCSTIKISHQHILWWLWIVIPSIVILGLIAYAIVEKTTKYERVRMDSEKALTKLGVKSESERKRAVYWLISNGTKEDLKALADLIHSDNSIIRGNAAWAIGGISNRLEDKTYGKLIVDKLKEETDPITKEEMVAALCDIGYEKALPVLDKYLMSEQNEKLRFQIAEALEKMALAESVPYLVKIINGENTETLKLACRRALKKIAEKEGTTEDALIKKHS